MNASRLLKKLWTDGLSASQIAAELGGITRNAVIGKVHRLGLSGRAKSPSSAAPRPRKARPHQHMMRSRARPSAATPRSPMPMTYDAEAEPELVDNVIPDRSAPDLAGIDRGDLPLADRRSRPGRLLLLRRADRSPACPIAPITRASPISRANMRRDRRPFRGRPAGFHPRLSSSARPGGRARHHAARPRHAAAVASTRLRADDGA